MLQENQGKVSRRRIRRNKEKYLRGESRKIIKEKNHEN